MKHILVIFCLLAGIESSLAQVSFGVKLGATPATSLNNNHIFVNRTDPLNEFQFNTFSSDAGIVAGAFVELPINDYFFYQVEALYQQVNVNYIVTGLGANFLETQRQGIFQESQHRFTLPMTIGAHLGKVDIQSGFQAHVVLTQGSELAELQGYKQDSNSLFFGMYNAIGINLSGIKLELGYQLDFQNYGKNRSVNGQSLQLNNAPGRLVSSVSYRF